MSRLRFARANLIAVAALIAGFGHAPGFAVEKADPVRVEAASGEYRTAWLTFEQGAPVLGGKPAQKSDVPVFLGVRDEKAVTLWFAHPALAGQRVVFLDRSTLRLAGGRLAGELSGRTALNWGDKNVHDYVYSLDGSVDAAGKIAGSYAAAFTDDAGVKLECAGKLSGQFVSAEETESDALASGQNWPHYYGDGYRFAGPKSGVRLGNSLALARPVWKSEAFIPTAYGSAPDSRYFDRAGRTDNGGGSSSPVVADGRVYQFFYYPRGPVGLDKAYAKYETEADLAAIARQLFPKREVQQQAVLNHFRTQADEVLVCIDAATGRTLWRTTFPQRGNNYQTHKHRGHFPVALVAGGTVYQPGTTGRLYAVDAVTGRLRFEYPDAEPDIHVTKQGGINCHAPSPVLAGKIVAFAAGNGVTGIDAQTGRKVWHQPLWHRSSLTVWSAGERPLILASDRKHDTKQNDVVALDAATGAVVWRAEVQHLCDYGFPLLAESRLVAYSLKLEGVKPGENDGLAVIHAYDVSAKGLTPAWTSPPLAPIVDTVGLAIDGGRVYVSAAKETFCLSLANGQKLAGVPNVGGARTQTLAIASGRLLLQPEGRHGRQSFFMLNADPSQTLRVYPASAGSAKFGQGGSEKHAWAPPHSWTTAYANQPIVYPFVDGRLFIRGLDGIYCYDLRAKVN